MEEKYYNYLSKIDQRVLNTNRASSEVYSGADIEAIMYLPLLTKASLSNGERKKFKKFADLQTMSISSTRSVSPVRVLGRSSAIGYTRGARTFAGSLIFATVSKDPFIDVADSSVSEGAVNASTSLIADQLPPFSIVITAGNEAGAVGVQVVHGITITNYGTTYSINDLYTETTYTYVATDVVPLNAGVAVLSDPTKLPSNYNYNSISHLLEESMGVAYGTHESAMDRYYRLNPRESEQ